MLSGRNEAPTAGRTNGQWLALRNGTSVEGWGDATTSQTSREDVMAKSNKPNIVAVSGDDIGIATGSR
jgi:hypothetical protein